MARYLVVANQTLGGPELEQVIRDRIQRGAARFVIMVPTVHPDKEPVGWRRGFALAADVVETDPRAVSVEAHEAWEEAFGRHNELVEQAQARAESRLRQMIAKIEEAGGQADGEVGGGDPVAAVRGLLRRDSFDEVIISTLPVRLSRWLKMDLPSRVSRMTDAPVTTVIAEE